VDLAKGKKRSRSCRLGESKRVSFSLYVGRKKGGEEIPNVFSSKLVFTFRKEGEGGVFGIWARASNRRTRERKKKKKSRQIEVKHRLANFRREREKIGSVGKRGLCFQRRGGKYEEGRKKKGDLPTDRANSDLTAKRGGKGLYDGDAGLLSLIHCFPRGEGEQ